MSYLSHQETSPLLHNSLRQYQPQETPHPHSHSHTHPTNTPHSHSHLHSHNDPSLALVRDAFAKRDILSSIELHNLRTANMNIGESHDQVETQSNHVGNISAAIQGLIISMVVVQVGIAAGLKFSLIFTVLTAMILSVGFGIASNEVLQINSHNIFVEGEASRERWELEINMKGEIDEMVALYVEKGVPHDVAIAIWQAYAQHPKIFLEAMMAAEISVIYPLPEFKPKKLLFNRFCSFFLGAFAPILNFLIFFSLSKFITFDDQFYAISSLMISLFVLFYLGSKRNTDYPISSQNQNVALNNGLQSMIFGFFSAVLAWGVGKIAFLLQ